MAEYLMPGDEIRPAIQAYRDLTKLIKIADGKMIRYDAPVYVRMVDEHGRDQGDSAILAVVQDADGAIRLVVQR